jgi:hypothetical protein
VGGRRYRAGMRFRATLQLHGKTATGFVVPDEVVEKLGGGKRPAVTVTLNGRYTYRNTVAPMGGMYMIGVSAEHRAGAGVAAGEELDVELELDTAPRTVLLPDDFATALGEAPEAERFFGGLSVSRRGAYVTWIESAKKPETRQKRVVEAVAMLTEGRTR